MMKVSTPTLQMSAGGPTTSPFNISGAIKTKREMHACYYYCHKMYLYHMETHDSPTIQICIISYLCSELYIYRALVFSF